MQMIRAALLFVFCLVVGAASNKRRTSLRQPASQEVIAVVPVPVMTVEVFEEPSSEASAAGEVSDGCVAEVQEIENSQQRMMLADKCEKRSGLTEDAIKSLQHADRKQALTLVEKSFQECANLTAGCAAEVAPQVVLKIRLSGVLVETACMTAAKKLQQTQPNQDNIKCQANSTKIMAEQLMQQDLEGAIQVAEEGLRSCTEMKSPCDFQLAPVVVLQLLRASQQQEAEQEEKNIVEVLLAGMRKAQVVKAKAAMNNTKHMSLLAMAERVRIAHKMSEP